MNITEAIDIINNVQEKRGMGLLELVTEYDDGRNERGFNPDFGVVENMAFKVFMVQAKQFFAET